MSGYLDTVNADGSYNLRVIMGIAVSNAKRELPEYARLGLSTTFNEQVSRSLKLVWHSARSIRAAMTAGWENSKLSPVERRAQQLEQQAEIAEGAIPSRNLEARALRLRAAQLRAPELMIAAE